MAAAGYDEDNPLRVDLYAPFDRYLRGKETAEVVAKSLNDVGFDARVQLAEWTAFRAGSRIKGDQPGAYDLRYGWNSNEWFDGARTRSHVICPDQGGTSSKLCDEEVTARFLEAIAITDQRPAREPLPGRLGAVAREPACHLPAAAGLDLRRLRAPRLRAPAR